MRDLTPNHVPKWISELRLSRWQDLLSPEIGSQRVVHVSFDPSRDWRTHGMMPEYKIKVDVCVSVNRASSGLLQYVLKGSTNPKEAEFYSATRSLGCPVLPKLPHIWLESPADGYYWMLMDYYGSHSNRTDFPSRVVRSMAVYHAWFWDNLPLELTSSHWDESEVFPFTNETSVLASLEELARLHEQCSGDWPLPALGSRLEEAVGHPDSLLTDFYSCPKTVVHCDLHEGNFLDPGEGPYGVVIDWAGACVNVPFFDLMRTVDLLCANYAQDAETLYGMYRRELSDHGGSLGEVADIAMQVGKARLIFRVIRLAASIRLLLSRQAYQAGLWRLRIPEWASLDGLHSWVSGEIQKLS